jgi:ribonuclease-3
MQVTYPPRQRELEKLIKKLGLATDLSLQWHLLNLALTHPTSSVDANYQQLEFVGDAVVRLAAAELLLETYPDAAVGEFAAIRSELVSDRSLAEIADCYGLDDYLLMSASTQRDTLGRQSRLADALEAVIGALYLSSHTLEFVRPWLDTHFKPLAEQIRSCPARLNYKHALQGWTQTHYKSLPEYRVRETQPLGAKVVSPEERFTAEVWVQGKRRGRGKGRSKKMAEQAAAQEAFLFLNKDNKNADR